MTRAVEPAANSFVQFRVLEGPSNDARLKGDRLADRQPTNAEGVASIDLVLGQ